MKEEIDSRKLWGEEWSGFGNWIGKVGRRRQQKKILKSLHLWMNGECGKEFSLKDRCPEPRIVFTEDAEELGFQRVECCVRHTSDQKQCRGIKRLKYLPPMQETWVRSLGREDPLEKEMVTHSSILAWKIPWMEKPANLFFETLTTLLCVLYGYFQTTLAEFNGRDSDRLIYKTYFLILGRKFRDSYSAASVASVMSDCVTP
ncbi:hypothetical protein MG293_000093 [Ovis ammon polii]|uniref:Uncharacterized protein n=1 Tax=Ovis ammon polii TaxID=230172 RepID=A0AAD4UK46_OVIAM|nr:hypothetical protein MG293_000093 [Ovis ammon polii]